MKVGVAGLLGWVALPATGWAQVNLRAVSVEADPWVREASSLSLDASLENLSATARTVNVAALLTVGGIAQGARTLGNFSVTLAPGERRDEIRSFTLPPSVSGTYRLAIQLDPANAIAESNEWDNLAVAAADTQIQPLSAELAVLDVSATETEAQPGAAVTFTVTVENRGQLPATFPVAAYLTRDAVLSTADFLLGTQTVTLAAGARTQVTIMGQVPAAQAVGAWLWGAIADPDSAILEADKTDNTSVVLRPLTVFVDTLSWVTEVVPNATLTVPYEVQLQAAGGDGSYTFRIASGNLPGGLRLADATLSGTPNVSGTFSFDLEARSRGRTARRTFEIEVTATGQILDIVTRDLNGAATALPYDQVLVAFGGEPPYTWTLTPDGGYLPPGMDLSASGLLSGIPTQSGRFNFGVTVQDALGARDAAEFALEVTPAVAVTVQLQLPDALPVGEPVDFTLRALGGKAPYTWRAVSEPPPGLSITEDGRLVGTPVQVGRFPVLVRATDSTRARVSDDVLLEVKVIDAGEFEIRTQSLPTATSRARYEVVIEAQGGQPPLKWRLVPGTSTPEGFYLTQGDGTKAPTDAAFLYGIGYRPGEHAFAIRVEDAYGRKRELPLLLVVVGRDAFEGGGCSGMSPQNLSWALLLVPWFVFRTRRR